MRFIKFGEQPTPLMPRFIVVAATLAISALACAPNETDANPAGTSSPDRVIEEGTAGQAGPSGPSQPEPLAGSDDPCSSAYLDENLLFLEDDTFYMREPLATLIRDRNAPDCYGTTFTDAERVDRLLTVDDPGNLLQRIGIVSGARIDLPRRLDSALISSRGWSYLTYEDASLEAHTVFVGAAPDVEDTLRPDLLSGIRTLRGDGRLQIASTVAGLIFVDGEETGMTAPTRHLPIALGQHTVQLCIVPGELTPPINIEVIDDSAVSVIFTIDETSESEACAEAIANVLLPVVDPCNAIELTLSNAIQDVGPLVVEVPAGSASEWAEAMDCAEIRLIPREQGDRITLGVFGARPGTVWSSLGLRNGDRLITIDGQPVDAGLAATLSDAFTTPREAVIVELERRGSAMQLQFNVVPSVTDD